MREKLEFEVINIKITTDNEQEATQSLKDELNRLGELGYEPALCSASGFMVIMQRVKTPQ